MRSLTNSELSSLAPHFKLLILWHILLLNKSMFHIHMITRRTHQNSDSGFHADVASQSGSILPESNFRLV